MKNSKKKQIEELEQVVEKKPRKIAVQTALLCVFGFGLLVQFFQISNLEKRVERLTPGAPEESDVGGIFGSDDEGKEDELSTLLFDFVNNLGTYEENKARYEANLAAVQGKMATDFWTANGLSLREATGTFTEAGLQYVFGEISSSMLPAHPVLILTLGYEGTLSLDAYGTTVDLADAVNVDTTLADVQAYMKDDLAALRTQIQNVDATRSAFVVFEASPEFQTIVTQKGLKVLPEAEQSESYLYGFQNSEAAAVAECRVLKLDASVNCKTLLPEDEVEGAAFEELKPKILEIFGAVDARTELQKKVDSQKDEITRVLSDPAFTAALKNAGLTVGAAVETDASLQYPILNASGAALRLLILDKATGEVKVSQPDGQDTQSLAAAVQLLEFSSKKKLWTSPVSSQRMLS